MPPIDRYLDAFENGSLDEQTCGRRVRDLNVKIDQLRARRDALEENEEVQPSAEDIDQTRRELEEVLANGENGERKEIINAHVAEIKINGHELIPVFMIPARFRTLGQVVGPQVQHAKTSIRVVGEALPVKIASSCRRRDR